MRFTRKNKLLKKINIRKMIRNTRSRIARTREEYFNQDINMRMNALLEQLIPSNTWRISLSNQADAFILDPEFDNPFNVEGGIVLNINNIDNNLSLNKVIKYGLKR